jgi:sulfatase maturation enzyme AslB (radical SAM superfamily)
MCIRNYHGFPYNFGYKETNLTLEKIKKIVPESVVAQLKHVLINGNLGDLVMNPETPAILSWLQEHGRKPESGKPGLILSAFTNGGAQGRDFWQAMAATGVHLEFCIDGLEDTHHIYRQNTVFETVIKNAQTFIAAGGYANWCMTEFDHNRHQINEARERSEALGFKKFNLRHHGRDWGPVYNQHGQKIFELRNENFKTFPDQIDKEWIEKHGRRTLSPSPNEEIKCKALHSWSPVSMYIAADGTLDPCCFIGNFSKHGTLSMSDIHKLKNNDTVDTLEKGVVWFNQVIDTFDTPNQLTACNTYCTKKSWYQ